MRTPGHPTNANPERVAKVADARAPARSRAGALRLHPPPKMSRQPAAARKQLLERRAAIARSRSDNESDSAVLRSERRAEERAGNEEIADVLMRLSDRERIELGELDAAIARIDAGTWGRCERCEGAIGRDRLAALPEARTCIKCGA